MESVELVYYSTGSVQDVLEGRQERGKRRVGCVNEFEVFTHFPRTLVCLVHMLLATRLLLNIALES